MRFGHTLLSFTVMLLSVLLPWCLLDAAAADIVNILLSFNFIILILL